ncbi:potassium-transporting ATPase subunit A [Escherichia coli]|nr:potassium-transporting ATPase subunit A [Escherichia coli]HAG7221134.1 potassium-transporting ATPase subunit A [Escherichia coli]HAL7245257.1 potassium-transporting ATPase subunit A [Escherichia coli]HAN2233401.1 potassium-transporting ATPase subunit A [Escherichia coli]HAW8028861.1 potassium-transporting ATPase subunit A [Escherichia coli]
MAAQGFLLIATFLLVLMVLARPLGSGLARLINDIPLPGTTGVERVLFRALGVSDREMNWKQYLCAILGLNMLGLAVLFFMLLGQHYLPLNPQQLPGLSWDLALNTAVSFVTNTNWQSYSGETTLSYFSQMAGLTVQNFLSAASGIAVIFALIRAFTRQSMSTLGNAWVDLLRITLWVLVPVALLIALFFIQQGALQNFLPYQAVNTVEGAQQLLPMGPVASQEAIKMLGTNGGGFFNANSSHPFENPTALTNFVQMLAIFLIPTALCFAFGEVTGDRRQGRMLLWAMSVIFVICVGVVMWAEVQGNPHLLALGTDSSINMEGKESREGYFPKIFSRVTKVDAPVQGMLTIVIIQSGLALMTISPSLNSQFNVLVNLAVVTNIIPYILSMAALVIIQKVANVPPSKAKVANFVAFVGAMYSFYALYSSGEEAMLYGSIVTFLGWTLYGLVSPRFELKNKHG